MVEILKKDWKRAKQQNENLLVNALINTEHYKSALEMIEKKLKEFPDAETESKNEIKQAVNEALDGS